MSSKIEVCKTCNGTGIEYDGAGHTCTACSGIAAPVVERQSVPCPWLDGCTEPKTYAEAKSQLADAMKVIAGLRDQLAEIAEKIKALCKHPSMSFHQVALLDDVLSTLSGPQNADAPPELAELQATIVQQRSLIESLRNDMLEAISIDCGDDAIAAMAEVERFGIPGDVIREMNDELVDLRAEIERLKSTNQ